MARHAAVDLAQVLNARYDPHYADRLPPPELQRLHSLLAENGMTLRQDQDANSKLNELRLLYEPYVHALAVKLSITLPPWIRSFDKKDNWQAGPWDRAIQARSLESIGTRLVRDHF
jgi:hypothetical protein